MLLLTEVLLALTSYGVWCYAYRPYISHLGPFICRVFFSDLKMIRSLCFATAVALLASPTALAFKFKDDGEVDEAATFFGEDSDSTLAAEPAAQGRRPRAGEPGRIPLMKSWAQLHGNKF